MISPVTIKYASRGLLRNPRRLVLSLLGIGVGVAIAVICLAWIRGQRTMTVRAAAETGAGHLRIVPQGYLADRDANRRLYDFEDTVGRVRSVDGVKVVAPHLRTQALAAMGTRSSEISVTGVDPAIEPGALRFVRNVSPGRYLRPFDEARAVVGKAIADRLGLALGAEIVVTLVARDGDLKSGLFTLLGIIDTGSADVDQGIFHVPLRDLQAFAGTNGVSDVTVLLHDGSQTDSMQRAIAALLPASLRAEVATYREIAPGIVAGSQVDEVFLQVTMLIVIAVVVLGMLSAQLAAVIERRRESAVLAAIGMSRERIWLVHLSEALMLTALGTAAALAIAVPITYYLATTGVDLAALGGSQSVGGVLLDPGLYGDFGLWTAGYALALTLGATLAACTYPAWFASRVDPASALRVD
jgi:ABC-type lipoprotein release transport system permease subunit